MFALRWDVNVEHFPKLFIQHDTPLYVLALHCMVILSGFTPGSQALRPEKMEDLTATQVPLSITIADCIQACCDQQTCMDAFHAVMCCWAPARLLGHFVTSIVLGEHQRMKVLLVIRAAGSHCQQV